MRLHLPVHLFEWTSHLTACFLATFVPVVRVFVCLPAEKSELPTPRTIAFIYFTFTHLVVHKHQASQQMLPRQTVSSNPGLCTYLHISYHYTSRHSSPTRIFTNLLFANTRCDHNCCPHKK